MLGFSKPMTYFLIGLFSIGVLIFLFDRKLPQMAPKKEQIHRRFARHYCNCSTDMLTIKRKMKHLNRYNKTKRANILTEYHKKSTTYKNCIFQFIEEQLKGDLTKVNHQRMRVLVGRECSIIYGHL